MYVPDVRGRVEEGAQKHGFRLEDLERAEEKARHVRAARRQDRGGGCGQFWHLSSQWLTVLFVFFQVVVPSDPCPF